MYNHVHQQDNTMPLIMQVTITIWRDICNDGGDVQWICRRWANHPGLIFLFYTILIYMFALFTLINCITSFRNLQ